MKSRLLYFFFSSRSFFQLIMIYATNVDVPSADEIQSRSIYLTFVHQLCDKDRMLYYIPLPKDLATIILSFKTNFEQFNTNLQTICEGLYELRNRGYALETAFPKLHTMGEINLTQDIYTKSCNKITWVKNWSSAILAQIVLEYAFPMDVLVIQRFVIDQTHGFDILKTMHPMLDYTIEQVENEFPYPGVDGVRDMIQADDY